MEQQNKWQRAEAMIRDGWSFGYAMSFCGMSPHDKDYAFHKEHQEYKRLNELYKQLKNDKRVFAKEK